MDKFVLHSDYQPTGDQPQAIEQLVQGFKEGNQFQTLLGVTGSGKTFTMANIIEKLNKPTNREKYRALRENSCNVSVFLLLKRYLCTLKSFRNTKPLRNSIKK